MAKDEDFRSLGATKPELQMVTALGAAVANRLDPRLLTKEAFDLIGTCVTARLFVRRRLGEDEPLEGGQHGGAVWRLRQRAVHAKTGGNPA